MCVVSHSSHHSLTAIGLLPPMPHSMVHDCELMVAAEEGMEERVASLVRKGRRADTGDEVCDM